VNNDLFLSLWLLSQILLLNLHCKVGINPFSDLSDEEFSSQFVSRAAHKSVDPKEQGHSFLDTSGTLPTGLDIDCTRPV
jgi:hypothetical protein